MIKSFRSCLSRVSRSSIAAGKSYKFSGHSCPVGALRGYGKISPEMYNLKEPRDESSFEQLLIGSYKDMVRKEYKFIHEMLNLKQDPESGLGSYKQLPDDSQFIEQHYTELKEFQKYVRKNFDKSLSDCDADELVESLYEFIQQVLDKASVVQTPEKQKLLNVKNVYLDVEGNKMSAKSLLSFLIDVKLTLNLNSNHTFILETLLHNKEVFDIIDKKITSK